MTAHSSWNHFCSCFFELNFKASHIFACFGSEALGQKDWSEFGRILGVRLENTDANGCAKVREACGLVYPRFPRFVPLPRA